MNARTQTDKRIIKTETAASLKQRISRIRSQPIHLQTTFFSSVSNAFHSQFNDLENEIYELYSITDEWKKAIFISSRLFAKNSLRPLN